MSGSDTGDLASTSSEFSFDETDFEGESDCGVVTLRGDTEGVFNITAPYEYEPILRDDRTEEEGKDDLDIDEIPVKDLQ